MIRYADRVQQFATVSGTASYVLGVAVLGFRGVFSVFNAGEQFSYLAQRGDTWEVGIGTVNGVGGSVDRTKILSSSNSNAAVSWANASVVTISCVHVAEQIEETSKQSTTIQTVGPLKVLTGQNRWYPPSDVTFTKMSVWVGVASSGNIEFVLKKNGIPAITGALAAGLNRVEAILPDAHAYAFISSPSSPDDVLPDINDNNFFDNVVVFVGERIFLDGDLGNGWQPGVFIVGGTPNNYTLTPDTPPMVGQLIYMAGGGTVGVWRKWTGTLWQWWDLPPITDEIINADSFTINLPLTHRDYLTLDITQVGSPQPGANLSVRLME
ncbi:MAG: hypothetical protein HQL07_00375 [Nitrospirae bacterium]|nr:hypothetical protein [Magnetococcales bacterium]